MIDSIKSATPQGTSAHLWRGRRVVIDPAIQPDNLEIMLVYFVEGHKLVRRNRASDQAEFAEVPNQHSREDALAQYAKWRSTISNDLAYWAAPHSIEDPPPRRRICGKCGGQGIWYDTHNKPTYGVISEGPNIRETCNSCLGAGFVEDLLPVDSDARDGFALADQSP